MKKSERLRQQKTKAVERMSALVALAGTQARDLTSDEKTEYEAKKQEAESLTAQIESAVGEEAVEALALAKPPMVDEAKLRTEAKAAERLRISLIDSRIAAAHLPAEAVQTLRSELITGDADSERISTRIFEEMAKKPQEKVPTNGHTGVTGDEGDKIRETMTATLLHRYEPVRYKAEADKAREWMGYSLMEMSRECLRRKGTPLAGKGPGEVAHLALTTSDLPNILLDAANKTLRAGYENYPNTFQAFTRRSTARDFKNVNRTQLSGAPALLPVNEHGEIKQGFLTDSKEAYALASYGRILNITRKTIINDDLSALTRVPELMGRKAAILEGDIVWSRITANAAMSDSVALFHATHGNLAGSGAAPDVDTVGAGSSAMTLQTGLEGDTLNLMPKYLAVPVALRLTTQKLLTTVTTILTVTSGVPAVNAVPDWIHQLQPIVEPRLDANSQTAWYIFADPGQVDTIEYCYLEGQEGMFFETQMGFEIDGVKFKARHDFGAGVIDYRGMYKNAGA
jgi:hypothetical protein